MTQEKLFADSIHFFQWIYSHAHHKSPTDDMIAHWLVCHGALFPPCKVGKEVFFITRYQSGIQSGIVRSITINEQGRFLMLVDSYFVEEDDIFKTYEEAEKALKEVKQNDNKI